MKPTLSTSPSLQGAVEALERGGAVGVHDVEQPSGRPAATKSRASASAVAAAYSAGFQTTALPQSSAGTRYHDGTATGKLPAVMIDRRPDRHAEREQLLVRHLARHRLPVEPAALAEEEVAGVDDLLHLAARLGERLADLPGDQPGQRLVVRLDEPADRGDHPAAHRGGHGGPVPLRASRGAAASTSRRRRRARPGDDVGEVGGVDRVDGARRGDPGTVERSVGTSVAVGGVMCLTLTLTAPWTRGRPWGARPVARAVSASLGVG